MRQQNGKALTRPDAIRLYYKDAFTHVLDLMNITDSHDYTGEYIIFIPEGTYRASSGPSFSTKNA